MCCNTDNSLLYSTWKCFHASVQVARGHDMVDMSQLVVAQVHRIILLTFMVEGIRRHMKYVTRYTGVHGGREGGGGGQHLEKCPVSGDEPIVTRYILWVPSLI